MDLKEYRKEIDSIDSQITALFQKRMETAAKIAKYKSENNLPVFSSAREREIMNSVTLACDEELQIYTKTLYQTIFDMSRSYQKKLIYPKSSVVKFIEQAENDSPATIPERAVVACQGVEGAYSQQACSKIFTYPTIMYFRGFEEVFKAVDSGLCRYGILPLENSSAGSVTGVYDLMNKYRLYITHSLKMYIGHSLLANKGAKITEIKEIFSHEQALNQCSDFLARLDVKVTVCENTAAAAKKVAQSGSNSVAAIGSKECAELYSLDVLDSGVQNTDNNYTRFICISKVPEIYQGAKKTSIMLTLAHKPGSLYNTISRFASLGLNLTKLESRPIPGSDFEFMFYLDIGASASSESMKSLLNELEKDCERFNFLGSYTED